MTKIILIQARPASRLESRENLDRALNLLEGCQGQEADLICFPEYFPFSGEQELAAPARGPRAYLVAGLVEHEGRQDYNTATLFDRSGRLLGRQRKHYLGNLECRGFGVQPGGELARMGHRLRPSGIGGVHRILGPTRAGPSVVGPEGGSHR